MDKKTERTQLRAMCKKNGVNPDKMITPEVCGRGLKIAYTRGMHDAYYEKANRSGIEIIEGLLKLASEIKKKGSHQDPIKHFLPTYLTSITVCEDEDDFVTLLEFIRVAMDAVLIKNGKQPFTTALKDFGKND